MELPKTDGREDKSAIRVGNFHTHLLKFDRKTRHKISKHIELNNTVSQQYLTNIYWTLNPITIEYIFFSSAQWAHTKTEHNLGHKPISTNFLKLKLYQVYFPTVILSSKLLKLEINNWKVTRKYSDTWKLNNTIPNNLCQW